MARIDHLKFGLHSKIPTCCVEFFINEWDRRELWMDKRNPYVVAVHASRAQYVQCPECLGAGRVAKIVLCDVHCGGNHRQDFELAF